MWCKLKTWLGLKLLNIANRFCGIPGPFDKINIEVQNTLVDKIEVAYKIDELAILAYKNKYHCSDIDAKCNVINRIKEKIAYDLFNEIRSYISFYTINEDTIGDRLVGRLYVGKPKVD